MFLVYSPSRYSYMGWCLDRLGLRPCYRRQEFETRAAAEDLASVVEGGVVVDITLPLVAEPDPDWCW